MHFFDKCRIIHVQLLQLKDRPFLRLMRPHLYQVDLLLSKFLDILHDRTLARMFLTPCQVSKPQDEILAVAHQVRRIKAVAMPTFRIYVQSVESCVHIHAAHVMTAIRLFDWQDTSTADATEILVLEFL